jgi:hypothetical protein
MRAHTSHFASRPAWKIAAPSFALTEAQTQTLTGPFQHRLEAIRLPDCCVQLQTQVRSKSSTIDPKKILLQRCR